MGIIVVLQNIWEFVYSEAKHIWIGHTAGRANNLWIVGCDGMETDQPADQKTLLGLVRYIGPTWLRTANSVRQAEKNSSFWIDTSVRPAMMMIYSE